MEETLYGFLEANIDGTWVSADKFINISLEEKEIWMRKRFYDTVNPQKINRFIEGYETFLPARKCLPANISTTTIREINNLAITPFSGKYNWLTAKEIIDLFDTGEEDWLASLVKTMYKYTKDLFKVNIFHKPNDFRVLCCLREEKTPLFTFTISDDEFSSSWKIDDYIPAKISCEPVSVDLD